MLHTKFCGNRPTGSREDVWTCGWTDKLKDGCTPDHGYTISSPGEPLAQGT